MMVPRANAVFDAAGTLIDEKASDRLREFLERFAAYADKAPR